MRGGHKPREKCARTYSAEGLILPGEPEGRRVLRFVAEARSQGFFAWLFRFRVDDRTVATWEPESGCSLAIEKRLSEGRAVREQSITFDRELGLALVTDPKLKDARFTVGPCVLDVLSAFFVTRLRGVPETGELTLPVFDNGKHYQLGVRFLGRERLDLPGPLGLKVATIVVEPLLLEGTGLFVKQGRLKIWLTDDARRIPVRMRSKVAIGSVSADLEAYTPAARGAEALPFPRLLAGFLALAPLVVLPGLHDFANLPQSAFVQVGASFLLLLFFCWRPSARVPFGAAPFDVPLLAFGLWSAASLLWAHTRYPGAELALGWLACGVVYGLVSRTALRTEDREELLRGVLIAGVVVAALGLGQQTFGLDLVPQVAPPAGTFANRNVAAGLMVLALPVAIVRFVRAREPRGFAGAALAGAAMAGYLFHTFARSAWLAFALELILLGVLGRRLARGSLDKAKAGVAAAGVALLALLMSVSPQGFRSPATEVDRLAAPPKVRSVGIRLAVWRDTLAMVRDRPWAGVGLANLEVYYPAYAHSPRQAHSAMTDPISGVPLQVDQVHNEYLQVAAELGLVGLGLLAWLGARAARLAARLVGQAEPETAASVLAALGGLVGLGVDAFFSFPLHRAIPPLVAAAYLGLLATAASPVGGGESPAPGPRWRIAAAALALLGVLAWSERRLRGDHHVLRMLRADAASEWTRVIEEGAAARRANPFPTLAPFRVASAHLRRGEPGEAIPPLERIVADYPYHVGALGNLGIARLDSGDLAGARECFARVLALVPEDGLSHYNLGLVLERMGHAARATEELGKAVAADPENAFYREALRRVTGGAPSPGVH